MHLSLIYACQAHGFVAGLILPTSVALFQRKLLLLPSSFLPPPALLPPLRIATFSRVAASPTVCSFPGCFSPASIGWLAPPLRDVLLLLFFGRSCLPRVPPPVFELLLPCLAVVSEFLAVPATSQYARATASWQLALSRGVR